MEYAIGLSAIRSKIQSPPKCYKVDLADPETKLAIEVDGNSHLTKKWRFLDARKTEILSLIGWSVLRFTNQEVDRDQIGCAEKIASTISMLRATKITSPMAS